MPKHYYTYGIKLSSDRYCDISSFEELVRAKRIFSLYRWDDGYKTKQPIGVVEDKHVVQKEKIHISGYWLLIGRYFWTGGWRPSEVFLHKPEQDWSKTLMPMHLLFKGIDDLKEWMGEENYTEMIINLM